MSGEIPISTALGEALPESISDLLSRDPEGYQRQDRARVIAYYREKRAAWQAGEKEKAARPKAAKAPSGPLQTTSTESVDELF